jgi:polyisoprenoid-binding protein YceI
MKKIILAILVVSFTAFSFTIIKKTNYKANIESSKINWKGFKPTGSHYGTINLADGNFIVNNDKIVGGEFTINMNSIIDLDMPADNEYNAKLVGHLKSEDFFDVAKFPNGSFNIKEVENKDGKSIIKGELTLKGITHPVSFLADVKIENGQLTFKSETFKIDRSKWNIRYKSKSFFDDLKDKFIDDEMEISIDVIANK